MDRKNAIMNYIKNAGSWINILSELNDTPDGAGWNKPYVFEQSDVIKELKDVEARLRTQRLLGLNWTDYCEEWFCIDALPVDIRVIFMRIFEALSVTDAKLRAAVLPTCTDYTSRSYTGKTWNWADADDHLRVLGQELVSSASKPE